jgi:hypothetical protein
MQVISTKGQARRGSCRGSPLERCCGGGFARRDRAEEARDAGAALSSSKAREWVVECEGRQRICVGEVWEVVEAVASAGVLARGRAAPLPGPGVGSVGNVGFWR